jgi:Tfp pilus assembly pilus retraction ATPase PilT
MESHSHPRPTSIRQAPAQNPVLDEWLAILVGRAGSDLLLIPGAPASIRFEGEIRPIGNQVLDGPGIEAAVVPALSPHGLRLYRENQITDSSYRVAGLGRFRINLHHERGLAAAAIRALPANIPSLGDLNLPASVEGLTRLPRGLVLIGGPAGSGKSTTLAALIDLVNQQQARHIITIEDPVEYEHIHFRTLPIFPRRCGLPCGRRRTSSWSEKCAILKPCALPSPQPRPGTWFFQRCIPLTSPIQFREYPIRFP